MDNTSSVMNDCVTEIRRNCETHFDIYLIPNARPRLIECLVQHSASKRSFTVTEREQLQKLVETQLLPEWTPIIDALDKGNMMIENAFQDEKYLDSEILTSLLKTFAKRRLVSAKGNEDAFEKYWTLFEDNVRERNKRLAEREVRLGIYAIELVDKFYREELDKIKMVYEDSRNSRLPQLNEELESTALQIFETMYDFGKRTESWTMAIKSQMAESKQKGFRQTPRPSQVPTTSSSSMTKTQTEQKGGPTMVLSPASVIGMDCTTRPTTSPTTTLSSDIPSWQTLMQHKKVSESAKRSPHRPTTSSISIQSTFVVHIPRDPQTPVRAAVATGTKLSKPCTNKEFSKCVAVDAGRVLIGENARRCSHYVDLGKIGSAGPENIFMQINGVSNRLRYEEVFGLFLAQCRREVERDAKSGRCIIVIHIMATSFERQSIRDAATCSGWPANSVRLVSEPTAIAFGCFISMANDGQKEDSNVLVVRVSGENQNRVDEFVLFTISPASRPHVHMKSVSGSMFTPKFGIIRNILLTNHEKYMQDVLELARDEHATCPSVSRLLVASDKKEVLNGRRFALMSTCYLADLAIIHGAMALGVVPELDNWISECFQYEIRYQVIPSEARTLFLRGSHKSRKTIHELRISSPRSEIRIEVWNVASHQCPHITQVAAYSVQSKTPGKRIESAYITFEVDSSGILTVSPLTMESDLVVTRLDSFNLGNEQELAACRTTVTNLMSMSQTSGI